MIYLIPFLRHKRSLERSFLRGPCLACVSPWALAPTPCVHKKIFMKTGQGSACCKPSPWNMESEKAEIWDYLGCIACSQTVWAIYADSIKKKKSWQMVQWARWQGWQAEFSSRGSREGERREKKRKKRALQSSLTSSRTPWFKLTETQHTFLKRAGKMVQQVKTPAAKLENLSLISRTLENWPLHQLSFNLCKWHTLCRMSPHHT